MLEKNYPLLSKYSDFTTYSFYGEKYTASGFKGYNCRPALPPYVKKLNHIIFQVGKTGFKKKIACEILQ